MAQGPRHLHLSCSGPPQATAARPGVRDYDRPFPKTVPAPLWGIKCAACLWAGSAREKQGQGAGRREEGHQRGAAPCWQGQRGLGRAAAHPLL